MNIQSLSIVVPTGKCWNQCKFCVSRMHKENYGDNIVTEHCIPTSYLDRIKFVRDEGCNTMIFTGVAEPQQNLPFIYNLLDENRKLPKPFYNIAIQTTGTGLYYNDIFQLAQKGVTTLAISLNSFNDEENWNICNALSGARTMTTEDLITAAHLSNMNVRLCYNLTSAFNKYSFDEMIQYATDRNIEQVTFRKIYASGNNEASKWIEEHEYKNLDMIRIQIQTQGNLIAKLPYGFLQYSIKGTSVVLDDDCMSKDKTEEMKYAILRPNGHLYSRWDDKGSLIF